MKRKPKYLNFVVEEKEAIERYEAVSDYVLSEMQDRELEVHGCVVSKRLTNNTLMNFLINYFYNKEVVE